MKDYAAVVERESDGRYSVYVPDLPGCASMGDTRRQALANVREAIACYVEGHHKLGRPIPRRRAKVEVVRIHAA
jgi:predicted RNase H-like HicB family nuclease